MDKAPEVAPVEHAALTVEATATPGAPRASWLTRELPALLALLLTLGLLYLVYLGHEDAIQGLIQAFALLVGLYFGGHLSLKVPGRDV